MWPVIVALGGVGFFAIVAQTVFIREFFVVVLGNELVVGAVLAAWLAGVALGAYLGGLAARKAPEGFAGLLFTLALLAIAGPNLLIPVRLIRVIFSVAPGQLVPAWQVCCAALTFVGPAGFLVGAAFPMAARALPRDPSHSPLGIPAFYVSEALGSVVGGLVFTFLMVGRLDSFQSLWAASVVMTALMGLCALGGRRSAKALAAFSAAVLALSTAGLLKVAAPVEKVTRGLLWSSIASAGIYKAADTPYRSLTLARDGDQFTLYSDGFPAETFPDEAADSQVAAVVLTQNPAPRRVLLLGSGAGGLAGQLAEYPAVERVDLVVPDRGYVQILPDDFRPSNAGKVKVHFDDPRRFVRLCRAGSYDLLFSNVGDPVSLLSNRLFTREFMKDASRALTASGTLAIRMSAYEDFLDEDLVAYVGLIWRTVRTFFKDVVIMPESQGFLFASVSQGVVSSDPKTLVERFEALNGPRPELRHIFADKWAAERVRFLEDALHAHAKGPVNFDNRPAGFLAFLKRWDHFAGDNLRGFFNIVGALRKRQLFALLIGAVFLRILWLAFRKPSPRAVRRFNVLAVVAATGFAGFALEIILLTAYQTVAGSLYGRVALLVAAFMLGLAAGGAAFTVALSRWKFSSKALALWLIAFEIAVVAAALASPLALSVAPWILIVLTGFSGFLVGAEFPVAVYAYAASGRSLPRTAGNLDAADNLGAILGAACTGTLLLPALGFAATGEIVAALNFAAGALVAVELLMFVSARKGE